MDTNYGSVRAPAEMGRGTIKINVTFPEWKVGKVVPATFTIPVAESKSNGKER